MDRVPAPSPAVPPPPPKSVLGRGLALLTAFGPADGDELTLAQLCRRTGLPKATAHRLLAELVALGAVERVGARYRLGLAMFLIGQRVPARTALREAALPFLQDLYEATHENVHLAVPAGTDTLFLEKLSGRRSMPIISRVGGRLPAHCTSTGKLFLALGAPEALRRTLDTGLSRRTARTIVAPGLLLRELAETAARGYALNREESEAGVSSVAAPVLDGARRACAALSVTGATRGLDLESLVPVVRTAASALTARLAA